MHSTDDLFQDLTEPQARAVRTTEGPLLIVAAAGSGKTRVITRRIAYLISCGVPPWSILALTFTNKAAGEMRERVLHLLGGAESRAARGLTVTTFHALCARLLRKYADAAGLKPEFTIYDSSDQAALCKKTIEACQLSTSNFPPRSVLSAISNAKNALMDADAYTAQATEWTQRSIAKVFKGYERGLRAANAVDFDDLLLLTAKMLKTNESVRAECRQRWQYLLIDEYQDTNHAQFVIASMIAGSAKDAPAPSEGASTGPNICVVGDPDQSIYGWRGADLSNILEFEEHYPGAKVITLGENFRSTAPILAAADTLIRNNRRRRHKDLFTSRAGGEVCEAILTRDEQHEARVVADWLRARHGDDENPVSWKDMAVFYRTNSLSRVMEESLRQAGIPYTIARGTAFYDREEIKNALAYLRVVANPADDVSLSRIVNTPARGIGKTSLDAIERFAAEQGEPLIEGLRMAAQAPDITSRSLAAVSRFLSMLDGLTNNGTFMGAEISGSLADLVSRTLRESGLEAMYKAQAQASQSEADAERLDNLDELVSSARQFELEYDPDSDPAAFPGEAAARAGQLAETPPLLSMLRAFLEAVTLVADADAVDPSQGSVTLMTLHAAKGLEFGAVAMIGLEEGLLPHSRARESDAELEEERRLCFVGMTRAMRRLLMTTAKYRTHRGLSERTVPSRFLSELPREHVVFSDQSDVGQGLGAAWGEQDAEFQDSGDVEMGVPAAPRRSATASPFPVGCVVRHPQFGLGEVKSVTMGVNARAVIAFRDVGVKTLVLEYARLTRVK